jgi:AcrR family transcriptional regulator
MSLTLMRNNLNVNTINFMPTASTTSSQITTYHHGNLQNALLQVAIEAIAKKGVSEFSLSELARSLGVTPAAAYKHFANKEALLHALAQHGFDLLRQRFEAAAPQAKPAVSAKQAVQRFERIGGAYLQFGVEEPALFNLIFGKGATSFRKLVASNGQRTPTFAYLAEALEALHQFDVIANAPSAQDQWFAWSAIHGATELAVAGINGLVKPEQAAGVITTMVMKAFR